MIKKLKITVLGETYDVTVEEVEETRDTPIEAAAEIMKPAPIYADPKPVTEVRSPISGVVSGVAVKVGDEVKNGDCLCTIEVMKMANTIPAPLDGVVTAVLVKAGDTVETETVLITME